MYPSPKDTASAKPAHQAACPSRRFRYLSLVVVAGALACAAPAGILCFMLAEGPARRSMAPVVLLFAFAVIVPVVIWLAGRARQRLVEDAARASRCSGCGYDLRATPDRCPECGRRPTRV